jgi:hypothetical protein
MIMKKLFAAAALISAIGALCALPAAATNVGVSVSIGEPGYYGQLDVGDARPRLIYSQPVLIQHRYHNLAPIYLRVPPGHAKNWKKYCDRYNACTRPVYFVQDDWYRNVYVPRYRDTHGHPYDSRGNDHRDNNDHYQNDGRYPYGDRH